MGKRIIIIGDHNNTRMCQILEIQGVDYDLAGTLDEACEKVFAKDVSYDVIILDVNFPRSKGMEATHSGDIFLELLEEKAYDIPVIINSSVMNPPKSDLVVGRIFPWEFQKFEEFLNVIKNKD